MSSVKSPMPGIGPATPTNPLRPVRKRITERSETGQPRQDGDDTDRRPEADETQDHETIDDYV